ncbi:hypothetical protein DdX_12291 [Ditylenchus destructor]|uniref:Uncharacterized protein n=1 Tax=Ditylenchus destructor TaxID=166010 RepID=A0AAD4MY19_9BILA|nr:hypothetical protein DdX_12291 [Ditylenchus destructor]
MRLNNFEYCEANPNSTCCHELEKNCRGIEYSYLCADAELFTTLAAIVEIPIDILDLVLSAIIIFVSVAGKINGSFKWCVMNIAILHLFYPIFGRGIMKQILMPTYMSWGWSPLATDLVVNGVLAIGTQGVTTSIAGSLPLALNRFMLTHQSRLYNYIFGAGKRCFLFLLSYDIATFGTFYLLNILFLLSNGKLITFPASIYYLTTISMVTVINAVGLILTLFVLYHIHSSVQLILHLDQKQMLQERKRIAWVIVAQAAINFLLCAWRLKSFYNVFLLLSGRPTYACYNPFLNFVNYFTYVVQEILVCLDSLIYIFFLTAYREELLRIFRKLFRRNVIHAATLSSVSPRQLSKENHRN